jgi:hypothetical protein
VTGNGELSNVGTLASLQVVLEREGFDVARARELSALAGRCARLDQRIGRMLRLCESPIERSLLLAVFEDPEADPDFEHDCCRDGALFRHARWPGAWLWVGPQYPVFSDDREFRCDFRFELHDSGSLQVVYVETDGHDWHEKTQEQVARDRSRERSITRTGNPVLRFTGSEVWASPRRCEREIIATLDGMRSRLARKDLA